MARSLHLLPATKTSIPNITGWWINPDDQDESLVWLEPVTDERGFVKILMRGPDPEAPPTREMLLSREGLMTLATDFTVHPVSRGYIVQAAPNAERAEELFQGAHMLNILLIVPVAIHAHVEPADPECNRLTYRLMQPEWLAGEVESGRLKGDVERGDHSLNVLTFDTPNEYMAMFERALNDEGKAWGASNEMVKLTEAEAGARYDAWLIQHEAAQAEAVDEPTAKE